NYRYRFLGPLKRLWFAISGALAIFGLVALIIWRLPLGIDFRGGATWEIKPSSSISIQVLREAIGGIEAIGGAQVAAIGGESYQIKLLPITNEVHQEISAALTAKIGQFEERQFQLVGPSVSRDLAKKAFLAVVLASILIIAYLAYAFRRVEKPVSSWQFGTIAVVALMHDLLISAGIFAALARFVNFEVDASFVTAMLTIMGFSVHDTIVVFDRVRENLTRQRADQLDNFEAVVDRSLSQTLNRSLATSLTVIFTLLALSILGGESIRAFVVTMLIGITVGTYSSIFTASPLLVVWQRRSRRTGHLTE
ncbi:MAG: protein translocase subunit SecF, partial [Patescibacteria group bacterium]